MRDVDTRNLEVNLVDEVPGAFNIFMFSRTVDLFIPFSLVIGKLGLFHIDFRRRGELIVIFSSLIQFKAGSTQHLLCRVGRKEEYIFDGRSISGNVCLESLGTDVLYILLHNHLVYVSRS